MATQYELTIDMPNLTKGAEVEIPGLGVFKNGSTTVLEDEQVATFRTYNRAYGEMVVDEETKMTMPSEVTLGPTPLQAVWPEGISVEAVKEEPKKTAAPAPAAATTTTGGDK